VQLGGWLDPQHLLNAFGLVGMGVIVFAESGLLIGLFLPGDSLLFTAGILVGRCCGVRGCPSPATPWVGRSRRSTATCSPAIAVIVGVSLLPLALEALRARRRGRQRRSRSQVGGLPGGGDGS
jgi:hypothetical protein